MKYNPCSFNLSELKIEVTYQCDLNCIHCSSDARPSNTLEMRLDDCLRILNDAAKMGIKSVDISGGEPFLWPFIFDATDAAAKQNMEVTVYTSGNITEFKQKATRLHDLGATRMIFSIFGANAITHERITRKSGSLNHTMHAIRDALSIGLITEIHFVPMTNNFREIIDVVKLASMLGTSRVSVLRLVPQGRAALIGDHILNKVQNLELRRHIQALRKEYGNQFVRTGSPYNFLILNDKPACNAAKDRLIIGPDLRIYPCDAFKRVSALELVKSEEWSSLDCNSLIECWQKSPFLEAVRSSLTADYNAPCVSCRLVEKCLSGCLAQKVIAYGSLDKKPDPACIASTIKGESA